MTNENLNPESDSQQRRFPSRRNLESGQEVPSELPKDNSDHSSSEPQAPRYGVRMADEQLAEFRRQQGLPPVGEQSAPEASAKGGWDETKGRFRTPKDLAASPAPSASTSPRSESANPYAPMMQSPGSALPQPPQPAAVAALPSRKGAIWTIVVSVVVMMLLPLGLLIYTVVQLTNLDPQGNEVGQLREVKVNEQIQVRQGQKAWMIVQGADPSGECGLVTDSSAEESEWVPSTLLGISTLSQQILSFPPLSQSSVTVRCVGQEPAGIMVGTGDFEGWSFTYSRVLIVSLVVGFLAFSGFVAGIIWLVKVNSRRRKVQAEGVSG